MDVYAASLGMLPFCDASASNTRFAFATKSFSSDPLARAQMERIVLHTNDAVFKPLELMSSNTAIAAAGSFALDASTTARRYARCAASSGSARRRFAGGAEP